MFDGTRITPSSNFYNARGCPKLDIDSGKIVPLLMDLQQNEKVIKKFIYQK